MVTTATTTSVVVVVEEDGSSRFCASSARRTHYEENLPWTRKLSQLRKYSANSYRHTKYDHIILLFFDMLLNTTIAHLLFSRLLNVVPLRCDISIYFTKSSRDHHLSETCSTYHRSIYCRIHLWTRRGRDRSHQSPTELA